jgi:uncharacterized protein (TIGR04141 family)
VVGLKISFGSASLYVKDGPPPKIPEWTTFLIENQDVPEHLFLGSRSEAAVLIFRDADAVFALTFGMGFHLLNLDLMERDFGLRVTLNSIAPDKLRSLDKASYEANPLNTRNQSPKDADIFDLHIDTEMDMVYALTGASTEPMFGEHVTGRDALTIMPEARLDDLPKILAAALARYKAKMPERFSWVDNVNRVREPDTLEILDLMLTDLLQADPPGENVWAGRARDRGLGSADGLLVRPARANREAPHLAVKPIDRPHADHGVKPSAESFKDQAVHVNDANYESIKRWSAYRCVYAELPMGGKTFILRNGAWHSVSDDFVSRIDNTLSSLEIDKQDMPVYKHPSEGAYNESVAHDTAGYELLDKKNISFGGSYDKIEFCDLVRDGHELIHVKFYRSSATLSHLFAQGSVSAETFVKHQDFRVKLNEKLPAGIKLIDPLVRPAAEKYRVVYAIATVKTLPAELPFFSKVTLKNAVMTLRLLVSVSRWQKSTLTRSSSKRRATSPQMRRPRRLPPRWRRLPNARGAARRRTPRRPRID